MESENQDWKLWAWNAYYMYVYDRKKSFRGIKDNVIMQL